jgi:hypothetical protein
MPTPPVCSECGFSTSGNLHSDVRQPPVAGARARADPARTLDVSAADNGNLASCRSLGAGRVVAMVPVQE